MYKSRWALSFIFRLGAGFILPLFGLLLAVNWIAQQLPSLSLVYSYREKVEFFDLTHGLTVVLAGDYLVPASFLHITPVTSPDKHWIALENSNDGVWVFNLLHGTRALLPLPFAQPIWSPDSRFVASIPLHIEETINIQSNAQWMEIQVADVLTGETRLLTPQYQYVRIWAMGWSADSQYITFVAMKSPLPEYTFYRVNRDGGDFHALDCILSSGGTDQMTNFMFAPGGERVAFTAKSGQTFNIFVLNLADCVRTQISDGEPYDDLAVWSPDGQQIAFLSGTAGQQDIYLMAADGKPVSRLTATADNEVILSWSPDGCCLLYIASPVGGGTVTYYYADLRDSSLHPLDLHHRQTQSFPAWGP